jgi:hypothetical protein
MMTGTLPFHLPQSFVLKVLRTRGKICDRIFLFKALWLQSVCIGTIRQGFMLG